MKSGRGSWSGKGFVPRLVDHDVRRKQITDAVRRVIAGGGLDAVTFQSVAKEAGCSVRLVQYYFGTKEDFLLATHRSVMEDAGTRFTRRVADLGPESAPRDVLHAVLTELLPLDETRREEAVVLGAFNTAAIASKGISADDTHAAPRALVTIVAHHLRQLPARTADPELDAELVLAAIGGTAQGMLSGVYTPDKAVAIVDRLLDLTAGD